MGNFDFIKGEWPTVHADCALAETYLKSDPRAACFYSRRAAEVLVGHLYDLCDLEAPYQNDLAARINHPDFKVIAGVGITQKLNLLRRVGNTAVHDQRPIPLSASQGALNELFHVVIWAAYRYSTTPDAVPTGSKFNPSLAAKAAPLSHEEVNKLAAKFSAQDEAHRQALAQKDEVLAQHEAELAELRAQVKTKQAAKTAPDQHDYKEADTRLQFIDVLLREAGWLLEDARDREYEVSGMPSAGGKGYVDYVLWGADGLPLAVIEAKRTSTSAQVGQQQAKLYADCLQQEFGRRPVVFYTNGYEHWLWDDVAGYPPRPMQGFYTRDELELLIQRRQKRLPLGNAPMRSGIVDRHYQFRAIKAVGEHFDSKQREALLVMATGSGKTRTVIALVEQLIARGWVKRVLFLADRTALVKQAANAFRTHLPDSTTVNLVEERMGEGRVYVSTYPTILNLIDGMSGDGSRRVFGAGHFDLVIIDEAHRSVYQKYGAIFDWFDALLVGLTATPKDEVDHNTYRLFHLEDGVPTDAYDLEDAVAGGYLVPPKGVAVGTKFLRQGIKYADLNAEEKDQWDALDWGDGETPDEVDAQALNRFLFNDSTVDQVISTLMKQGYKVAGGDRLGKTIIFAKSQAHAEFIQTRFDLAYPELKGEFARVITHGTPYAQSLIDDFSVSDKAPHIAISVDMLDTGIDVPEVVNLVFFKTVHSTSKFWQMIGRGTRLRPDLFGPGQDKTDFLVFDFCGNLEFFSQELPGSEGSAQKSLTQRLFEARLGLIARLDRARSEPDLRKSAAEMLHEFVAGMNTENVLVRAHRRQVERFAQWDQWQQLTPEDAAEALEHLANLPSGVRDTDEAAKRFDLLMLRRQLAQLDGDAVQAERIRETVQALASELLSKSAIPSVAEQLPLLDSIAGDEWWIDVTLPMLEVARLRLRSLIRFVEKSSRNPVYTDFADSLDEAREIELPRVAAGMDWGRFREKASAYLKAHEDHVALQRLRRNRQLTAGDLTSLEAMLLASGIAHEQDLARAKEQASGLGLFIRQLIGLDRAAAVEAFARFIDGASLSADQVRFIDLIIDELTTNGVMEPGRLYESPYTDSAPSGPDYLFSSPEVGAIVEIVEAVNANAVPHEVA